MSILAVLLGKRDLSLEHAEALAGILNFSDAETEYFFLLIQFSRAGTDRLRRRFNTKIIEEQRRAMAIGNRLGVKFEMNEETKAIFYSTWLYSGVRNLTAIADYQTAEAIADKLSYPRSVIQEIVEFLLTTGLCQTSGGRLEPGPSRTHLRSESPHVLRHHQNWRLRGFEKMPARREEDVFFTFPFSASEEDCAKIRRLVPKWTEDVHKIVAPSPSEAVRCLNIDFFEY